MGEAGPGFVIFPGASMRRAWATGRSSINLLEMPEHELRGLVEIGEFGSKVTSDGDWDFGKRHLNGNSGCQLDISGFILRAPFESELQEFAFVFKKIHGQRIDKCDLAGPINDEVPINGRRDGCNHMQTPMPVLSRAIVNDLQLPVEDCVIRRRCFSSVVRLYRLKPVSEFIREWGSVDGVSVEFPRVNANGKLDAVFVGGRIASMVEDCNLIDEGIQGGAQLIKKRSQFKSGIIFGDNVGDSFERPTCPIAIHVRDGHIGFWIDYSLAFSLKGYSVRVGSPESLPTVRE